MKKKNIFIVLITFLILLSSYQSVLAVELNKENFSGIDTLINEYIDERKEATASVSLGIFKDGEVIYEKYYGLIDVENKKSADKDSIYEWGSVSKALIWVSVMQLVEEGKIDLEEDINSYFSDDFKSKLQYKNSVTMKDLMNHQAGFQEITYPMEFENSEDIVNFEDLLILSEPAQIYEPGTVTAYNNWSAALAAYVVESVSGQLFYEYVNENIFEKLGMDRTSIKADWSDNDFVKENRNLTKAYYYTKTNKDNLGESIVHIGLYPAGACAGTLEDFLKFSSQFTDKNTKLFKNPKSMEELKKASSFYSNGDDRNHHGLWSIDYGSHLIGHSGNTQGFSSSFFFDPETNTGYGVMTNEVGEMTYNYGLCELLYGKFQGDLIPGEDISGIYSNKRTIDKGFARFIKYLSMVLPISKGEEEGDFHLSVDKDTKIISMGNNNYRYDTNNGLAYNLIKVDGRDYLETFTSDMEKIPLYEIILVIFLVLVMLLILLSGLISIFRFILKANKGKILSKYEKYNYYSQVFAIIISGIFFYLWLFTSNYMPAKVKILSIISSILSLGILANLSYQLYNKIKDKNKVKDLLKSICLIIPLIAVVFFQIYNFWS